MSRPPVAAVIVAYQSADCIADCVESLLAAGVEEIIVVDNAADEATGRAVCHFDPPVRLLTNNENRGFAAGVNQGVAATTAPLVLIFNPDARLEAGLSELAEEAMQPETGIATGALIDGDGGYQAGFGVRAFPTPAALAAEALLLNRLWAGNPINRRYRRLDFDPSRPQDVEQPAGAFLLVRREVFERLGGMDERFHPLWFEDVDFCLRVKQAGLRIRYRPEAVARHEGGHSIRRLSMQARQAAWYGSLLRFADKHFSPAATVGLRACCALGLALRGGASLFSGGKLRDGRAYFRASRSVLGSPRRLPQRAGANLQRTPVG